MTSSVGPKTKSRQNEITYYCSKVGKAIDDFNHIIQQHTALRYIDIPPWGIIVHVLGKTMVKSTSMVKSIITGQLLEETATQ